MKEISITPNIKFINADCIETMSAFDDDYFDLALVDPPYGIGDTWSKSRKDRFYRNGKLQFVRKKLSKLLRR